jgi:predicted RNA-binding protein with PIN domain
MPADLLIDGYNLLHAAGLALPRYGPGDLHRRRARLLQKLGELLDQEVQARTTVVFDARRDPPESAPPQTERLIRVVFAPAPLEADDLIEQLLARHSAPRQLLVVSSDRRLRRAAQRRGATSLTSEAFLDQIEDEPPPHSPARPRKALPPSRETPVDAESQRLMERAEQELKQLAKEANDVVVKPESEQGRSIPDRAIDPLNDPEFWQKRLDDEKE